MDSEDGCATMVLMIVVIMLIPVGYIIVTAVLDFLHINLGDVINFVVTVAWCAGMIGGIVFIIIDEKEKKRGRKSRG